MEFIISFLIVTGAAFCFLGSLGLARLPDAFMRLHGPSKATTLGIGCLALASLLWFTVRDRALSVHELLVIVFVVLTTPVSAHLIAKAALHRRLPVWRSGDRIP